MQWLTKWVRSSIVSTRNVRPDNVTRLSVLTNSTWLFWAALTKQMWLIQNRSLPKILSFCLIWRQRRGKRRCSTAETNMISPVNPCRGIFSIQVFSRLTPKMSAFCGMITFLMIQKVKIKQKKRLHLRGYFVVVCWILFWWAGARL